MFRFLSIPAVALLAACSGPQAYGTGQAWQRNECYRIEDRDARSRCLAAANTPYEAYERDKKAAGVAP